jgi:hypothetical protein
MATILNPLPIIWSIILPVLPLATASGLIMVNVNFPLILFVLICFSGCKNRIINAKKTNNFNRFGLTVSIAQSSQLLNLLKILFNVWLIKLFL